MRSRIAAPAAVFAYLSLIALVSVSAPAGARASDQIGTLTAMEGEVHLLTSPTDKISEKDSGRSKEGSRALFEGKYYVSRPAKLGDRVELGNVLRTSPKGRARVIFDNGDQYQVGPGTIYRVTWSKDDAKARADIDLKQGSLRGIITKGGPRGRLFIRTHTATLGVRGTDFSIGTGVTNDGEEVTEVSVLRGAVELTPVAAKPAKGEAKKEEGVSGLRPDAQYKEAPKPQPIEVKKGFTAQVSIAKSETAPAAEARPTTQEDLLRIQKNSRIAKMKAEDLTAAPAEAKAEVEKLEAKATEATINDLKTGDPQLYAKVEAEPKKPSTSDELNTLAVQEIYKVAPKAPPVKRKPFKGEIEDLGNDAYDKYFKQDE